MKMLRLEDTTAAPQARGAVVPWIFGTCIRVPLIPLRVDHVLTLRAAIPAPVIVAAPDLIAGQVSLTAATVYVGETDGDVQAFINAPSSGILMVGSEQMRFSSKNTANRSFGVNAINRGINGTQPAAHAVGDQVRVIEPYHVYAICEQPGAHSILSVDAIYMNGALKQSSESPKHVLQYNDTTIVPGRRLVTVTFDMRQPPATFTFTPSSRVTTATRTPSSRPPPPPPPPPPSSSYSAPQQPWGAVQHSRGGGGSSGAVGYASMTPVSNTFMAARR